MPAVQPNAPVAADALQQPFEVLIDGKLYDIRGFRHPGGNIVKFYAGHGDATEGFEQFHIRSAKAHKMLKLMPHRVAPASVYPSDSADAKRLAKLTSDMAAMQKRLKAEGWFAPSPAHCLYRCSEIIAMHILGLYLLLFGAGTAPFTALVGLEWVIGVIILGVVQGRCGWLMHEAGHHSMTGYIPVDIRLQELIYGVGCGMSGGWWRTQHNRHHATPQKLDHDVDLDTLPLVAFNKAIANRVRKSVTTRTWLRLQGFLFGPLTCFLVCLSWQIFLHPRYIIRKRKYAEAFWFAVRYFVVQQVAAFSAKPTAVCAGVYMLYLAIGASYIFINFSLSHTHLPVTKADEDRHWVEYSSDYTINIRPHPITNWWMGYLNFQIEHHMFPCMPQYRFVRLWPQVRDLFEANGLKYDVRGYFGAMRTTFANLHEVGLSAG